MTERCPNCDAALTGRYCAACGQKRIEPDERRLSWFVRQLVEAVTMVDERFLGSFTRLLFRPGRLERDWFDGRRRRHLAPLTLFLIANLAYFLYPPLSDFNLPLSDQVNLQPWRATASAMVEHRLAERGLEFADYAAVYGARAADVAKVMIILQVPVLAFVLWLSHRRREPYVVDHLAVSLNFHAFLLMMVLIAPAVLVTIVPAARGAPWMWQVSMLALVCAYAWRQLQVAYDQPGWLALVKLPLFLLGVMVAHTMYRALQFLLVFALT